MLITRTGVLAGLVVGAIALTACGSNNNSPAGGSNTTPATTGSGSTGSGSTGSATTAACAKGTLNSDGSTAQANAMTAWIKGYQTQCAGTTVNYGGGGSGQGVTDFKSGKVDFAGSDAALDPTKGEVAAAATRCGSTALDLPMVVGPIAIAYNLKGVSTLVLTPKLITQIFLGTIKTWDDPAIKAANSSATLPSTAITVFYRADQSGTTQNFEKYLAANDPTDYGTATPSKVWAGKVGQGKTGSGGIQSGITSTAGSIGYDEYSYVVNGNLQSAEVDNGGGAVKLNPTTAGAAVSAATITGTGNDLTLKLNYATKAAGAYPIVLVTYEIACTKYSDATKGALVKSFLGYTSGAGQAALLTLGYAPLPSELLTKVQASVAAIS